MSDEGKALLLSLLVHGALLAILYEVGSSCAWQSAPLVIDFSVSQERMAGSGTGGAAGQPGSKAAGGRPVKRKSSTPIRRQPRNLAAPAFNPKPKHAVETRGSAPIPSRNGIGAITAPGNGTAGAPLHNGSAGNGPGNGSVNGSGSGGAGGSTGGGGTGNGNGGNGSSSAAGNGGGASTEQLRNRYLREHFIYIRDLIQRSISYPARARKFGWSGRVVVAFVVHESGRISNERVVGSSGYELLDNNVISAIRQLAPFPRPPVKAELRIPIVYSLQ